MDCWVAEAAPSAQAGEEVRDALETTSARRAAGATGRSTNAVEKDGDLLFERHRGQDSVAVLFRRR